MAPQYGTLPDFSATSAEMALLCCRQNRGCGHLRSGHGPGCVGQISGQSTPGVPRHRALCSGQADPRSRLQAINEGAIAAFSRSPAIRWSGISIKQRCISVPDARSPTPVASDTEAGCHSRAPGTPPPGIAQSRRDQYGTIMLSRRLCRSRNSCRNCGVKDQG